jgi:hypothetical protein
MIKIFLRATIVALAGLAAACTGPSEETSPPQTPAAETAAASGCAADPAWIRSPSLPAEVPGTGSICNFEQFAWQSLLYLVQPTAADPEILQFESFMPNYGVFVAAGGQPTPYGQHPPDPCNDPATVAAKATGAAPFVYSNIVKQAGVEQPLIDPNGQFAWYGLSVNETAYDMLTRCELYRSDCAGPLKPGNAGTVDLIGAYPNLAFPDGAFELKTAWKVLRPEEESSGLFYSTAGWIQPPGQGGACESVTLGLAGIHVVGKTPETPALVWASFEHRNNAPDCSDLAAAPPLGGSWSFFDPATCDNCTTNFYEPGQPAQVCRMHPQGDSTIGTFPAGQSCEEDPNQFACQEATKAMLAESTEAIRELNANVQEMIRDAGGAIDPVWANYELVGNVWTRGGVTPPQLQAQVGSLSAANTAMETFVQNGPSARTNPNNCFSCHNQDSGTFGRNLPPVGLSHLFDEVAPKSGGCADGSLPAACGPYTTN